MTLQELVQKLKEKNIKIAVAESCTGGKIAEMIVSVSGASAVFEYGFVTYSNEAKKKMLDVNEEILEKYGAVSNETAIAMAKGAAVNSGALLAIATTGVAGPALDEGKPVGLVYIGYYYNGKCGSVECHFDGDREKIRADAAKKALEVAGEMILDEN